MSYCKKCGNFVTDGSNFCNNCGSPMESETHWQKRQEFSGKIIKCPSCGTELPSFTAICPVCGHEINSATVISAIKDFSDQLNSCDSSITMAVRASKKEDDDWDLAKLFFSIIISPFTAFVPLVICLLIKFLKIGRLFSFSPEEKRKETTINNFVFPNDRENVLEGLLFIKSQVESLSSKMVDFNTIRWINIWKNKAQQLYERAELLFHGDTIAANAYRDILDGEKKAKESLRKRVVIAIFIVVIFTVFTIPYNKFLNFVLGIITSRGVS